ncbi:MAG: hypothetical protein AB7S80_06650 [Rhizobiaceae bacterium]
MRQFLTLVIALSWAAAFALLSGMAAIDAETGTMLAPTLLGGAAGLPADMAGAAGLALAFAAVASLFLWAFAAAVLDTKLADRAAAEIVGVAVLAATVVVVMLGLTSATGEARVSLPACGAVLAALVLSRALIVWRGGEPAPASDEQIRAALHSMAAEAAGRAMLSRRSGRPEPVAIGVAP